MSGLSRKHRIHIGQKKKKINPPLLQPSETTTAAFLLWAVCQECMSFRLQTWSQPTGWASPRSLGFPVSKRALTIVATLWGCFMDRSFPFVSPVEEVETKALAVKSLCTFLTVA